MSNKFSKKHYEEVAAIFRNFTFPNGHGSYRDVALLVYTINQFAAMFAADNEKFDKDKFKHSCGDW